MSLATELEKSNIIQFWAAKIELPGFDARFFLGRGRVTIYGEEYLGCGVAGEDGVWGSVEAIGGETGDVAPRLRLSISGLQTSIANETKTFLAQGSPVTIYDVVWDRAALAAVADPDVAFFGFVDTPEIELGASCTITLDCASAWEYFFAGDEARRRNDRQHQVLFPGELGYQYATDTTRRIPWGIYGEARPVYTGGDLVSGGQLTTSPAGYGPGNWNPALGSLMGGAAGWLAGRPQL